MTGTRRARLARPLATLAVAVLALILPFMVDAYWLSQLVFVLIVALGALGLDVLTGRTGQISLGHSFFLAVGAYTAGVLGGRYGLTAALWIPAAGIVAGLLGALVGPTALRLRGLYLAIVTIGLVFIGQWVFVNVSFLSGGPGGESLPVPVFGPLSFSQGLRLASLDINRDGLYYYLCLLLLAAGMAFVWNLSRTRPGRAMAAVRDGEVAASVIGVDVARTKVTAFVVASALGGVAGALYGSYLSFVVPTQWDLPLSIEYVVVIVVGGMASMWGPLLGSLFVVGLPALLNEVSSSLPFLATGSNVNGVISPTDASAVVYGILLVVFLLAEPRGVVGLGSRAAGLLRQPAGTTAPTPASTPAADATQGPLRAPHRPDQKTKGEAHAMQAKRFRLAAATALLALAASACSTSTGGSSSGASAGGIRTGPGVDKATKTITLGVLTPLSGAAALIGKPLTDGQQAYFDYVNANGGIDGWKVKLDVQDTKYDPQTEVADYNQIIGNVLFIGQSLGSPTTQAIEPLAKSAGVLIGTAAQDSAFVDQKINAVIGTPYAVDVANAMYYVSQHKPGAKLGIIYQNDAYGQDGLKGFTAGVDAYHLDKVASATYNVTDTAFTSQVLAMKNAGANVVMLTAIPTAAAAIIGTAATQGYRPQWILQGPAWSEYLMTSTGTPSGTPTPVEKAMVGAWVLGYEAAWGDMSAPGMAQFLRVTKQYYPSQIPDGYYMYGYCLAKMETDVLHKAIADKDLTRAGVLAAKLHLGTVSFGGLMPTADYTPALGPADRETNISEVDTTSPGFLHVIQPYFESSAARSMTFGSSS